MCTSGQTVYFSVISFDVQAYRQQKVTPSRVLHSTQMSKIDTRTEKYGHNFAQPWTCHIRLRGSINFIEPNHKSLPSTSEMQRNGDHFFFYWSDRRLWQCNYWNNKRPGRCKFQLIPFPQVPTGAIPRQPNGCQHLHKLHQFLRIVSCPYVYSQCALKCTRKMKIMGSFADLHAVVILDFLRKLSNLLAPLRTWPSAFFRFESDQRKRAINEWVHHMSWEILSCRSKLIYM